MGIVEIIRAVVIAYAMLWTSYVVTLPLLSRVGGRSDGDRPAADDREDVTPNIVVIIPAHDMSEVITRCINSVQANNHDRDKVDIYVVADHCNGMTFSLIE